MDAIALQLREDAFNETVWDFAKGTGKPCGASHISAAYTCRLSEGERESIVSSLAAKGASMEKLNKMNDEQLSRANKIVKERGLGKEAKVTLVKRAGGEDQSDAEIAAKVKLLDDFEAKYGAKGMESLGHNVTTATTPGDELYRYKKTPRGEEITAVKSDSDRQTKLLNGFQNPASLQKGGENAVIKFREVPDEEVDMTWNLMSKNAQASFKAAGTVPNKDAWKGLDENGNNTYGSNSVERGKALLKRWLEQDGLDAYSGRPLSLNNADLEHVRPFSKNGRDAEQPSNWLWISRGLNTSKGDKDMQAFVTGVSKLDAAKADAAHKSAIDKATAVGGKADLKRRVKEDGFMTRLEMNENRGAIVDTYAKAGLTRYIAGPLGAVKNPEYPEVDPIKFVDKTGPNRGQVKQLLQTQGNWREGRYGRGQMTAAEWISRNYPALSPAQRAQFKNLYAQARRETDQAKAAGEKATGGTFTQRLADLTAEAFGNADYSE